jgi:hypothetical protein
MMDCNTMMIHIKELPLDLNNLVHSYMPYKQNFDSVLEELIRFDVYDCQYQDIKPSWYMTWKGKYTNGTIWCRGTCMNFANSDDEIQIHSLMELICYINGETRFPYANDVFGSPEKEYLIGLYDDCSFLLGDTGVRDELVRVDRIAKRYRVTQWWV